MNGRSRQWPVGREEAERFAASNLFAFLLWLRLARGRRLADRAALERWAEEDPGGFADAFWDFARVIGERGQALSVAENVLRQGGGCVVAAGCSFSCERLREEAAAFAAWFRAAGIGPGDTVGGWAPDDPESAAVFLGANALGAVWACEPGAASLRVEREGIAEMAGAHRGEAPGFVRRPLAAPLAILAGGGVARQEALLGYLRDILLRAEVRPDQFIVPDREPKWLWGIAALATGASVILG